MDDSDVGNSCPICIEDYTNTNGNSIGNNSSNGCFCSPFTGLFSQQNSFKKVTLSSCCNRDLCHKCLYAHIKSVLEEGITLQGRTSLSCPFPDCNHTLTDEIVRKSFAQNGNDENDANDEDKFGHLKRRAYLVAYHLLIGTLDISILMNKFARCLNDSIIYLFFPFLAMDAQNQTQRQRQQGKLRKMYDHVIFQKYRLNHSLLKCTQKELDDLELYERWSLTIALNLNAHTDANTNDTETDSNTSSDSEYEHIDKDIGDANQMYTHVTRCPTPNCPCLWLTNRRYYNEKVQNEQKYSSKKKRRLSKIKPRSSTTGKISKMLYKPFIKYLYTPLGPEREEGIMNENGYTIEHWLNHNDIDTFSTAFSTSSNTATTSTNHLLNRVALRNRRADTNIDQDGRVSRCPLCKETFCNLCQQPWHSLHHKTGAFVSHTNQRCSDYQKASMSTSERDELVTINNAIEARLCPGCGMRTNRTAGCNHMTCPCGYHWCYVCECRFSPPHYRCTDANPLSPQGENNVESNCIIS